MRGPRVRYYSSLVHHRSYFKAGRPVLMYHHLGTPPPGDPGGVLYVGPDLFRRQLRELKDAGYRSASPNEVVAPPGGPERVVSITFDDGYEDVFREGLAPLAEHGFRATMFLISGRIGGAGGASGPMMDAAQVRDWLAAGHRIGSHTVSHPRLTSIPRGQAREEIAASRKGLEDRFGVPIEDFCYPYGDWDEAVRDMVAEAGYSSACTTEPGLNDASVPPYEIRRLLACHPVRTPKQALIRLLGRFDRFVPHDLVSRLLG
jgi:peptidoglycan/xylan/chitin deacetylase (PgdA/CDA1 family)